MARCSTATPWARQSIQLKSHGPDRSPAQGRAAGRPHPGQSGGVKGCFPAETVPPDRARSRTATGSACAGMAAIPFQAGGQDPEADRPHRRKAGQRGDKAIRPSVPSPPYDRSRQDVSSRAASAPAPVQAGQSSMVSHQSSAPGRRGRGQLLPRSSAVRVVSGMSWPTRRALSHRKRLVQRGWR